MSKLVKCCFCGEEIQPWEGRNPYPVNDNEKAVCCKKCDIKIVLPIRKQFGYDRQAYLAYLEEGGMDDKEVLENMKLKKTLAVRLFERTPAGTYVQRTFNEKELEEYGKVLTQAIHEAKALREKYSQLAELEEVFDAIDLL